MLRNLGTVYRKAGKLAEAEQLFLRSLQLREASLGKDDPDVAIALHDLALLHFDAGQYTKSEPLFQRSLRIREAKLGSNHPDVAISLYALALLYHKTNQLAKAEPLYQRSLQLREARLGKEHADLIPALTNLAKLYRETRQYSKAEQLYRRNLRICEVKLGNNHLGVAAALVSLARCYQEAGDYAKAEPLYHRSLQIREAKLGKDHSDLAPALSNLGKLYRDMGQYAKAELLYQRGLQIREATLGKDHPDVAAALNSLARLYQDVGEYAKAESHYQRSLHIYEGRFGKDHPKIVPALNYLASWHLSLGQYSKAEPLLQRGLQIRESKLGKDHVDAARSLHSLAIVYREMRHYSKVESLLQRCLDIRQTKLGKDHREVANVLNSLANLYVDTHRYIEAEPFYQRSLQIREAKLDKNHPDIAVALNNLANFYEKMGQYAKAEPLYRRSLQIREAKLGKDHPDLALALSNLGWNLARQQRWEEAISITDRARRVVGTRLSQVLPVLNDQEQLTFLASVFDFHYFLGLSLGASAPSRSVSRSAEWLLNGRAMAHQTLAGQILLARDAATPETKKLAEELQQTRARLAAEINRSPQQGSGAETVVLQAREQELARQLARAVGRPYRADSWVNLDELRAKLGRKVFVDIACFPLRDVVDSKSLGTHYVAWITHPGVGAVHKTPGAVQIVHLGEAKSIDRLIEETRKTLIHSAQSVAKVGEAEAMAALQKPLAALSAKVLQPLLPHIEKYDEWIVCPDGALWLVPWNAFALPDGAFAVERYLIQHVVSGRDLVLEQPKRKTESAFLFADPDYDLALAEVQTASGTRGFASPLLGQRLRGSIGSWNVSFEFKNQEVAIYDEDDQGNLAGKGTWKHQGSTLTIQTAVSEFQGTVAKDAIRGQRSKRNSDGSLARQPFRMDIPEEIRSASSASKTLPRFKRLPGTALEAEAVRPHLAKWLGAEPQVFLEGQASELAVKSVKSPRILALATHGYSLPKQEVETKDQESLVPELGEQKSDSVLVDKSGQRIENPLLRCGLLLAGCNRRAEVKPGEDDGILTGLEIVGMDLRGTDLVVLSACETGLGDVRSGEGVAGLRQAFQLAGAKGVLASLWQVRDIETALLMNAFYGELTKGKSQAAALREAQLTRITARGRAFGAAHPFFWAAFTHTGRGE